jgi:hypothetical protein
MFRFTIRDVLWLTVVVALAVGWFVTNSRLSDSKNDMKYVEFWLLEANNPDAFGHLQRWAAERRKLRTETSPN